MAFSAVVPYRLAAPERPCVGPVQVDTGHVQVPLKFFKDIGPYLLPGTILAPSVVMVVNGVPRGPGPIDELFDRQFTPLTPCF